MSAVLTADSKTEGMGIAVSEDVAQIRAVVRLLDLLSRTNTASNQTQNACGLKDHFNIVNDGIPLGGKDKIFKNEIA